MKLVCSTTACDITDTIPASFLHTSKMNNPYLSRLMDNSRKKSRPDNSIMTDAVDPRKFIAHAGGAINGDKYTNSLEALDVNYKNGFRIFELDIITTSDDQFVAAHDWKSRAAHMGYRGDLPPTASEFLAHRILGKYSPMNLDLINNWFAAHPDATLVTDKINQPRLFSDQFIDKSRLIMELFTLDAVDEAVEAGVQIMPSTTLLDNLDGNRLDWLLEKGIRQIGLSRLQMSEEAPFIQLLRENGIRTFIFHVGLQTGRDEAWVVCNDFDLVWGMFADEWCLLPG